MQLPHLPLVPHICINELGQHWFRWWLVACSAPSHYLNRCWLIANWPPGRNSYWKEMNLKLSSANVAAILSTGRWVDRHVLTIVPANHRGWIEFRLCDEDTADNPASQACLDRHLLSLVGGWGSRFSILPEMHFVTVRLQLPEDIQCEKCVLQWKYNAGKFYWEHFPDIFLSSKSLKYAVGKDSINLTHWGRDKMAAIFQTTFSNAFYWMKMYEYRLNFHWSLFLRVQLTISQHWFR